MKLQYLLAFALCMGADAKFSIFGNNEQEKSESQPLRRYDATNTGKTRRLERGTLKQERRLQYPTSSKSQAYYPTSSKNSYPSYSFPSLGSAEPTPAPTPVDFIIPEPTSVAPTLPPTLPPTEIPFVPLDSPAPTLPPTEFPTLPMIPATLAPTTPPTAFPTLPMIPATPAPTTPPTAFPTLPMIPATLAPTTPPTLPPTALPTELPTLPFVPLGTPEPTVEPLTFLPTTKPTMPPTGTPTSSPTRRPMVMQTRPPTTATPTATPTALPTLPMVPLGTPEPTLAPTLKPTECVMPPTTPAPTVPLTKGPCFYSWVYCGEERSKCFDSFPEIISPDVASGWSIDMSNYDFEASGPLECEIWGGAIGCDTSTGQLLGVATIDNDKINYYIKNGYGATSFQAYAGECVMNDNGGAWQNDVECGSYQYTPYDIFNYPIVNVLPISPPTTRWSYGESNQQSFTTKAWTFGESQYETFPMNSYSPLYVSSHVEICSYTEVTDAPVEALGTPEPTLNPTSEPTMYPTSAPTVPFVPLGTPEPSTAAPHDCDPTPGPTAAFIAQGTAEPSPAPVTAAPTLPPTLAPVTAAPTLPPTLAPVTAAPTLPPTLAPVTAAPTVAPVTAAPTLAPVTAAPTLPPTLAPVTAAPTLPIVPLGTAAPTEHDCPPTSAPTVAPVTALPSAMIMPEEDCPPSEHIAEVPTEGSFEGVGGSSEPTPEPTPFRGFVDTPAPVDTVVIATAPPTPIAAIVATETPATVESLDCVDAYVKCSGSSVCFLDSEFNCYSNVEGVQPWGWNIEYSSTDGAMDTCEVWVNAENCEGGTMIGTASILPDSFTITLDETYSTASHTFTYNFYAGECIGSDGAKHMSSGVCLSDDVSAFARVPDSYPLTSGALSVNSFTFNSDSVPRDMWTASYEVFPLGSDTRKYLSGQVSICPSA